MKTYRSKISWRLFAPIYVLLIIVAFIIATDSIWIALLIIAPVVLLISSLLLNTLYTITDNQLKIKSGFIYRKTIDIAHIKQIKDTKSVLSSPATSFKNRIEISFNRYDAVIISPKEKKELIAHLLQINPDIQVKG